MFQSDLFQLRPVAPTLQTPPIGESSPEYLAWTKEQVRQSLRRELQKEAGEVWPDRVEDLMNSEGRRQGPKGQARGMRQQRTTDPPAPSKKDSQEKGKTEAPEPSITHYKPINTPLSKPSVNPSKARSRKNRNFVVQLPKLLEQMVREFV